jgi:hypothetical protein
MDVPGGADNDANPGARGADNDLEGAQKTTRGGAKSAPEPSLEPSKRKPSEQKPPASAIAGDVERLCSLFADLTERRTDPEGKRKRAKYAVTEQWRTEMRRLIEIDGRSPAEIEAAIRWIDDHDFWSRNILSVPKLRSQYDRIRLEAERGGGDRGSRQHSRRNRVRELVERARTK